MGNEVCKDVEMKKSTASFDTFEHLVGGEMWWPM